jgi:hypothetical protein
MKNALKMTTQTDKNFLYNNHIPCEGMVFLMIAVSLDRNP